jgi:hypothetical protein
MRRAIDAPGLVVWWCPGCRNTHQVPVKPEAPDGWDFDGNLDAPTLAPSVLLYAHETLTDDYPGWPAPITDQYQTTTPNCHSFVRAGQIVFLPDCTHELAGQTVPMQDIPQ